MMLPISGWRCVRRLRVVRSKVGGGMAGEDRHETLQRDRLAGGVEGFALHKILQHDRG